MIAELENKIAGEEPVIITGWRPHSMYAQYDLKFLEDTRGHFQLDNVYVISYQGLEEAKPTAYNIMSNWSIEVSDLEEMVLAYEQDGTSFDVLAEQWVEENRDKVDAMLKINREVSCMQKRLSHKCLTLCFGTAPFGLLECVDWACGNQKK